MKITLYVCVCAYVPGESTEERPRRNKEGDGAAAGGLAQTGPGDSGGGEGDPGDATKHVQLWLSRRKV